MSAATVAPAHTVLVSVPSARPLENLWALPLAFTVALVVNATGVGRFATYATAGMWTHELGHATWRWLNGRSAVPTLFRTLYFGEGRSLSTGVLGLTALATLAWWALQEECLAVAAAALGFGLTGLWLSFALPLATEHLLESFAGFFGEFWISTFWMLAFYYQLPSVLRWRSYRWLFLLLGAAAYVHLLGVFLASRRDVALLPWGSFFGGDGDLDVLLNAGWLVPHIRHVYFTVAAVCAAILGAHYVVFALPLAAARRAHGGELR